MNCVKTSLKQERLHPVQSCLTARKKICENQHRSYRTHKSQKKRNKKELFLASKNVTKA